MEVKPLDQWKVLYDILDEYLENHQEEKRIVYSLLESNITASVANTASSYNPLSINTNVTPFDQRKTREPGEKANTGILSVAKVHLEQCDSDVVVEEELEAQEAGANSAKAAGKKKRRGGRGKKKGRRKPEREQDGTEISKTLDTQTKDAVVSKDKEEQELDDVTVEMVLEMNACVEVADEILILNSEQDLVAVCRSDSDDEIKADKVKSRVVVVPPDQLSECELTDDESGCSEILDYDRNREDQSFIQAQWEAFQKEQEKQDIAQGCSSDTRQIVDVTCEMMKAGQQDSTLLAADIKEISSIDKLGFIKQESANFNLKIDISEEVVSSANVVNSVTNSGQDASTVNTKKADILTINTESLQGDDTSKEETLMTGVAKLSHQKDVNDQDAIIVGLDQITLKRDKCESATNNPTCIKSSAIGCNIKARGKKNKTVSEQLLSSLPNVGYHGEPSRVSSLEACGQASSTYEDVGRSHQGPRYPKKAYNKTSVKSTPNEPSNYRGENIASEMVHFIRPTEGKKNRQGILQMDKNILSEQTIRQNSGKNNHKGLTVVQVQRLKNWDKFVQRTARVVYLLERKHTRMGAGTLKLFGDKNPNFAFFAPSDHRIPRMKVPMRQCPPDFFARHQDYDKRIFLCKIVQWKEPKFALGELVRDVGAIGDVEAETEAMLLEYGVDYAEFPDTVLQDLPSLPWSIPLQEIKSRTDLRDECIFTIDPSTARDLDDAVSCLPLPSGNYRVGVHIADVSYFIPEGTLLDEIASSRATSVYLTQKVIPMLPRVLCEHLCSLNPGEDRLAFSVIWELRPSGEVVGEWFGRTVIRSCVKLSYEHAQSMIENPNKKWSEEEIPKVTGPYKSKDISKVVNDLQSIAVNLRKKRFQDGALRLDQVKIAFNLDNETHMPNGFYVYEQKDSNRLIEEFMLLANMAVAHKIFNSLSSISVLRRHPPPLENPMLFAANALKEAGIHLDISSAGALNKSIIQYAGQDEYTAGRLQVITSMCSKPMQFARYFCPGSFADSSQYRHYALNVPLYTHFTSPIRRYADLMVHRVLAASVDSNRYRPPSRDSGTIQKIAEHCNDRKQASKILQEMSSDLYLSLFIRQVKVLEEEGMVIAILDRAFDVLVLQLGVIKRVYTDKLPLEGMQYSKSKGMGSLTLVWKSESCSVPVMQEIRLFSLVKVSLQPMENDALKFQAILLCPS